MIKEILTGTDNAELRKVSEPVERVDKATKRLIKDMKETLLASNNGIALAAPQIGVHKRVIVISLFDQNNEITKELAMINPVITKYSLETVVLEEGCLSLPDVFFKVERPEAVVVTFLDEKGREQTLALDGVPAREVQHETDHLDGVLFTDYKERGKVKVHGVTEKV